MIVAFVGDINKHEALEIFSDHFKNFNNRLEDTVQNIIPDAHYISRHSVHIIDRPGAVQSNIKIGHIGVKRNNPDYIKVTVMNTLLGGYFGSRINYLLREIHGFTYGARSDFDPRMYSGEFSVNTDVRTEVTDTAINLIINELKKITKEKVSAEELQKVKNYISGVFPLQLETANAVASRVIGLKLYNLPSDYYNKYISEIIKITEDDILYTAVKYIKPEQLTIVVTGNAALLKDKLSVFGEVIIYDTDLNEKVLN
jgi:predicted Zn-dependent peptidase